MEWSRLLRHLLISERAVHRHFPKASLERIEEQIRQSEKQHSGEIRFAVESGLELGPLWRGQTPRARAIEVFSALGVWDTENNNGVLVYVMLADHAIEIVADRGIHQKVPTNHWESISKSIEHSFRNGQFETGVLEAMATVSATLIEHFPCEAGGGPDELPNQAIVLG